MTDNEIIKALECCITNDCAKCKAYDETYGEIVDCLHTICRNALDLINRQKTEIERLETEKDNLIRTYAECQAEAVKEFVDLAIKTICEKVNAPSPSESYIVEKCIEVIDNLLKEKVGEE